MILKFLQKATFCKFGKNVTKTLSKSLIILSLPLLALGFSQPSHADIYIGFDDNKLGKFKYYDDPKEEERKNLIPIIKHINLANQADDKMLVNICELQEVLSEKSPKYENYNYTYDDLVRNANKAERMFKNKIDADILNSILTNYRNNFKTYILGEGIIGYYVKYDPLQLEISFPKPLKVRLTVPDLGRPKSYVMKQSFTKKNTVFYITVPHPKGFEKYVEKYDSNYELKKAFPSYKTSNVKVLNFFCMDKKSAESKIKIDETL